MVVQIYLASMNCFEFYLPTHKYRVAKLKNHPKRSSAHMVDLVVFLSVLCPNENSEYIWIRQKPFDVRFLSQSRNGFPSVIIPLYFTEVNLIESVSKLFDNRRKHFVRLQPLKRHLNA